MSCCWCFIKWQGYSALNVWSVMHVTCQPQIESRLLLFLALYNYFFFFFFFLTNLVVWTRERRGEFKSICLVSCQRKKNKKKKRKNQITWETHSSHSPVWIFVCWVTVTSARLTREGEAGERKWERGRKRNSSCRQWSNFQVLHKERE